MDTGQSALTQLKAYLAQQDLPANTRLPPEREMSEILGVHRDTLKMRVYKARTLLCRSLAHLEGASR